MVALEVIVWVSSETSQVLTELFFPQKAEPTFLALLILTVSALLIPAEVVNASPCPIESRGEIVVKLSRAAQGLKILC